MRKIRAALFYATLVALLILGWAVSCVKAPQVEESIAESISSPASSASSATASTDDPEQLWKARCSQCHDYTRGQDTFKGAEWRPIVEEMSKKSESKISQEEAGIIYAYLYYRTTGKLPAD